MPLKHGLRLLNIGLAVVMLLVSVRAFISLKEEKEKVEMFVFIPAAVGEEEINAIEEEIREYPETTVLGFISPEEAVDIWADIPSRREILEAIGPVPFPSFFRVKLTRSVTPRRLAGALRHLRQIPGIQAVEYGGEKTVADLLRLRKNGYVFGLFFLASLVNILDHLFPVRRKK